MFKLTSTPDVSDTGQRKNFSNRGREDLFSSTHRARIPEIREECPRGTLSLLRLHLPAPHLVLGGIASAIVKQERSLHGYNCQFVPRILRILVVTWQVVLTQAIKCCILDFKALCLVSPDVRAPSRHLMVHVISSAFACICEQLLY